MLRSKLRSFLTIIAIFIGAFTLSLTNGIGAGISTYIDKQLGNLGAEDVLFVQPKMDNTANDGPTLYNPERTTSSSGGFGPGSGALTPKDIAIIQEQPGIKSAELSISASPDFIAGASGTKYQLSITPFLTGTNLDIAAGKSPTNDTSQGQLVIPLSYVSALGYGSNDEAVGKTVQVGITSAAGTKDVINATITGVQQQTIISSGGASVNRPLLQQMYDVQTTGLPAAAKEQSPIALARVGQNINKEELQSIKDSLKDKGYTALTIQDQIGIIKQVIDAVLVVLNGFAAIALLAASFGIINTLLMAVQERTKEIGLMKAMGMGSKKIFLLFSTEAVLLGFWGSLLGVVAANLIGKGINRLATDTFLKDLAGFELTSFPIVSTAIIMLVIMTIAFLAGTLPARRASKQNPIDALRYE